MADIRFGRGRNEVALIDQLEACGARGSYLKYAMRALGIEHPVSKWDETRCSLSIRNEANLTGGENVGGSTAAPAAPEVASDDDDGDGDGDPDPERQTNSKRTRTSRKSAPPPAFLARPRDACSILNVGRTKLHQLSEEDPRFPRKIVLGARCVGWRVDALHDYLRTCEREG